MENNTELFSGSCIVVEKPQVLISELKLLNFEEMTDEWLEFVVSCRRGISHGYDIVEGPMADDTIWDYIESYIEGEISNEGR